MKVWQGKARERIVGLVTLWAALLIFVCSASIAHQFTVGDQMAQAHAFAMTTAAEVGVSAGAAGHVAGAHVDGDSDGSTSSDGSSYPGSNYSSGQPGQTEPSGPSNNMPPVTIDPVEPVYPVNPVHPMPPVKDPPVVIPVDPPEPMPIDPPYCGGCGPTRTTPKGIACPMMQSDRMMPTYCLL